MSGEAVTLPWPDRALSPNSRCHWRTIAATKKKARAEAFYLAKEAGLPKLPAGALTLRITLYPPSRRRYDADNAISGCKAALDGIADAIGLDDANWTWSFAWGEPQPRGAVVVELVEFTPARPELSSNRTEQ